MRGGPDTLRENAESSAGQSLRPRAVLLLVLALDVGVSVFGVAPARAEDKRTVPVLGKFEGRTTAKALGVTGIANPYDATEIEVDAMVKGPGGENRVYPCFWYVPCEPYHVETLDEKTGKVARWERFRAAGDGDWRFRVCPSVAGDYGYSFRVTARRKTWTRPGGAFVVKAGDRSPTGFITLRKGSRYFRYRDGRPFIPLGQNLGWPEEGGSEIYTTWLRRLSRAGANCARLWLVHYFAGTALEWSPTGVNDGYRGVGRFSQEAAARVDRILEAAGTHGIHLILSFFSFGDTNGDWPKNPYAREGGGWLDDPADFFTDRRARESVRNRLRYAVARYGWCPNVWAWELWNEVETSNGYEEQAVLKWHDEMAGFLKSADPHQHLVTTSYRFTPPHTSCLAYGLESIDFVQVHTYLPQITHVFASRIAEISRFSKPVVIAEYGLYVSPNYFDADPAGLHVHDGLWAGVFCGSAGAGMTWWWERYIDPRNLYFHYTGLSRFLAGQDLEGARARKATFDEGGAHLFAFALEATDSLLVWLGAKRQIEWADRFWQSQVRSYTCGVTSGKPRLFIEGKREGRHTVVFLDTFDGVALGATQVTGSKRGLTIPIPTFRHDLALRCYRSDRAPNKALSGVKPTPIHDHFEKLSKR